MTAVQINGNAVVSTTASRSLGSKGTSESSSSFAEEMQAVLSSRKQDALNSVDDGQGTASLLETFENLLETLAAQIEEAEQSKDVPEELYASLQQVYQLLQKLTDDMKLIQPDMYTGKAINWLQKGLLSIQYKTPQQMMEEEQSIPELTQKLTDMLTLLDEKKPGVLPRDFADKLQALLSRLNYASEAQQRSKSESTQEGFLQVIAQKSGSPEAMAQKQGVSVVNESSQEKQQATADLEVPISDETTTTRAMHHQMQGNIAAARTDGMTPRNANLPLVPARFFVNEMEAYIVKQVHLNRGTGAMETTLRLFPEDLGRIDVRITALNGVVTAHFTASQVAGKEAVEQQLNQLRHALIQQGLHVEKIEVSYVNTTPGEQSNNNLHQQGREQSRQEQKREEEVASEETAEFNLAELLGEEGLETS